MTSARCKHRCLKMVHHHGSGLLRHDEDGLYAMNRTTLDTACT